MVTAQSAGAAATDPALSRPTGDLPPNWHLVKELEGQTYRWPEYREAYRRYAIYEATTDREGTVSIALGEADREGAWGRKRRYVIGFLTTGSPQTPLVEFLETDDAAETDEFVAVIRGSGGDQGRRMYGPGDSLPDVYVDDFTTEIYRDRIKQQGAWNKIAVIARGDDHLTMLNHALVQARRRGDI